MLFKRLNEELIRLRDEGEVLMRFNDLRETLPLRLSGEFKRFGDEELRAVLTLVERGFPSPAGRKTMAQRFNAGFPGREGNKSRQGRKNGSAISYAPPGLGWVGWSISQR